MYSHARRMRVFGLVSSFLVVSGVSASLRQHRHHFSSSNAPRALSSKQVVWGVASEILPKNRIHVDLRGGSTEQDNEYDEDDDEEGEIDEAADGYDSDEGSDAEENEGNVADEIDGVQIEMKVEKYDEPLVPSPMISLGASLGVMLLAKRVDLFHPTTVRIVRFLFIAYLIALQAFVFYVRREAKAANNRSPLTMSSPFSAVLNAQLGEQSGMMKNLASSLLSSESTVMEYDLKQAKSMQSGLLFNMLFMWFLHFKMNQVQPLIIQTITGISNLLYSPLFQVYILGKNLERPFKNPATPQLEASSANDDTAADSTDSSLTADDEVEATTVEESADNDESDEDDDDDDVESPTVAANEVEGKPIALADEEFETDSSSDDDE